MAQQSPSSSQNSAATPGKAAGPNAKAASQATAKPGAATPAATTKPTTPKATHDGDATEPPNHAAVVVTVTQPRPRGWLSQWRRGLQLIGLAFLAAGWGILTHLAIAQLPPPPPIRSAQMVLDQVAPVVERAFHGIYAWEMMENAENPEALGLVGEWRDRQRFGHFPYAESPPSQLMVIGSYTAANDQRFEHMQEAAGLALLEMIDAARQAGIWLVPISGFRTYERQQFLFDSKIEQVGSPERAAHTVAPPGYSEHHTGMAVDLADGLARALDLSLAFGETDAYRWLSRNAQRFGYELSFPPDNPQGISYEPWHWRYVGTDAAIATFAQGRSTIDRNQSQQSMLP